MARRLRTLAFIALVAAAPAAAEPLPRVHFALSSEAAPYMELVEAAVAELEGLAEVDSAPLGPVPDDAEVIVTVGVAAAQALIRTDDARPVFSVLIPAATWRMLHDDPARPRTALFLDQPFQRQVAMVRALLPPVRDLGVVLGPVSASMHQDLLDAAQAHGLRLQAARIEEADETLAAMTAVLRRSDALLALPDPMVFNRYTVQGALLTGFRMRRPVFGFSEAWVTAGALASVHSTPAQSGSELGGLIADWLAEGGELPPPAKPRLYTLSVNRQVAHALDLALPTDALLQQRLRELEAER